MSSGPIIIVYDKNSVKFRIYRGSCAIVISGHDRNRIEESVRREMKKWEEIIGARFLVL